MCGSVVGLRFVESVGGEITARCVDVWRAGHSGALRGPTTQDHTAPATAHRSRCPQPPALTPPSRQQAAEKTAVSRQQTADSSQQTAETCFNKMVRVPANEIGAPSGAGVFLQLKKGHVNDSLTCSPVLSTLTFAMKSRSDDRVRSFLTNLSSFLIKVERREAGADTVSGFHYLAKRLTVLQTLKDGSQYE